MTELFCMSRITGMTGERIESILLLSNCKDIGKSLNFLARLDIELPVSSKSILEIMERIGEIDVDTDYLINVCAYIKMYTGQRPLVIGVALQSIFKNRDMDNLSAISEQYFKCDDKRYFSLPYCGKFTYSIFHALMKFHHQ